MEIVGGPSDSFDGWRLIFSKADLKARNDKDGMELFDIDGCGMRTSDPRPTPDQPKEKMVTNSLPTRTFSFLFILPIFLFFPKAILLHDQYWQLCMPFKSTGVILNLKIVFITIPYLISFDNIKDII